MFIIILDEWGNKVDYRYVESEGDELSEIVQGFAKINNFTTKFCETQPELLTNSRQLIKYEEEMKKKVEASKADKKADKGTKEGSKADIAQDKKLQAKMSKRK